MEAKMEYRRFNLWQPHPWHGLEAGPEPPWLVNAYMEITPFDLVKYEADKATGYLQADRPNRPRHSLLLSTGIWA
jgi:inorganic pyrophosphatase